MVARGGLGKGRLEGYQGAAEASSTFYQAHCQNESAWDAHQWDKQAHGPPHTPKAHSALPALEQQCSVAHPRGCDAEECCAAAAVSLERVHGSLALVVAHLQLGSCKRS